MAIHKSLMGLVIVSILLIGIVLLGSVPQAGAETLEFKNFTHVTKAEIFPIGDVERHVIAVTVREGAMVLGTGEWAWVKSTASADLIKGGGPFDQYSTITFLDGSTITTHTKGTLEATPQGVTSAAKWTGDIIGGTGRFQGIKGTVTASAKMLPMEKGELGPKGPAEGTMVYTLPGK